MSSSMACIATRLMSFGAAKSGKPCERLTAPYFIASRVISRMTDSVNWLALRETRRDPLRTGVDTGRGSLQKSSETLQLLRGMLSQSERMRQLLRKRHSRKPLGRAIGAVLGVLAVFVLAPADTAQSQRNGIENTAALNGFFRSLDALKAGRKIEPVRIVHYGDSHTAA